MTTQRDERHHRVVLVDDTRDLRELMRLAMVRGGFDVVGEAADGREGIEVCAQQQPDVVLLDLAMPVMDGIEALPGIREHCPERGDRRAVRLRCAADGRPRRGGRGRRVRPEGRAAEEDPGLRARPHRR